MPDFNPADFVHLHLHTHYSFLDGLGRPKGYFARAKELGMTAMALTDHGVTAGLLEWYQEAQKAGIKPILGMEAYVARHGRHQKRPGIDAKPYHLILLAENHTGYLNLLKLTTIAHQEGFYYKPRIDYELLEQHGEGLIALSACLNGEVANKALSGNEEEAVQAIEKYQKIFGKDNFFLELQSHPAIPDQMAVNKHLIALSAKTGAPLVATNDCHYVMEEDAEAHDILLCIQMNKDVNDPKRLKMADGDLYLKSGEQMATAFADTPEALANTRRIADRCNVEIELGARLIPTYDTPFGISPQDYFVELCWDGLNKRFGIPVPDEYKRVDGTESGAGQHVVRQTEADLSLEKQQQIIERLEYEIGVILDMGFPNYFLIVWDFIKYAKEAGIAVGPGRGSAAGSLISYCLGITNLNPLTYGLLFERFLNPERVSMPDIDIDFADDKRIQVLDYVSDKYGRDHVARICTFGTMAAKAAIKDVGRTFGVSFADMNAFSALIPARPGISLADAFAAEPQIAERISTEPYQTIWKVACKIEGNIRQMGVHACAVVIADKELTEYTALQPAPGKSDEVITQYDAKPLETIGLLKMDFLGLRNLTIIQKCLHIIKRTKDIDINIDALPMDDDTTLALFRRAETIGVFQFESAGMRRYLKELKPTAFEDLIAMSALYRPGPMDNIPQYIKGKHHPESIKYPHPILEEHLKETYGVAVYQEQVQQVAQSFAGFSLGQGYLMIKAVAKKIPELLDEQKELFVEGAQAKGHTKKEAETLFALIEPFAGYGFNKSHSACYSFIAYQTGYLKAHYPTEFMAALLTSDHDTMDRLTIDIEECNRMGIHVLPPSVNASLKNFTVAAASEIRFGLSAIKGLGDGPIEAIIDAREAGGDFKDLADFGSRVNPIAINKRTLEALAKGGALDELGERNAILASTAELSEFAKTVHTETNTDQASLFGDTAAAPALEFHLPKVDPATRSQCLRWEKELLGMYVSSHPLAGMKKYLGKKIVLIERLDPDKTGQAHKVGGIITTCRQMMTKKNNQMMAFLTIEDPTGTIEISVFPKTYAQFSSELVEGEFIMVTGTLERRGALQVVANEIKRMNLDKMREKAEAAGFLDNSTGRPDPSSIIEAGPDAAVPQPSAIPPYRIRIPVNADAAVLGELKSLLVGAKVEQGGSEVEILIYQGEGNHKRVQVPFRVGIGDLLEEQIKKLLS